MTPEARFSTFARRLRQKKLLQEARSCGVPSEDCWRSSACGTPASALLLGLRGFGAPAWIVVSNCHASMLECLACRRSRSFSSNSSFSHDASKCKYMKAVRPGSLFHLFQVKARPMTPSSRVHSNSLSPATSRSLSHSLRSLRLFEEEKAQPL